jgi:P-type Cu+ transporter
MTELQSDLSSALVDTEVDFCTLDVKGMTCASCVNHVEKTISKIKGVQAVTVNLATEQAKVRFQDDQKKTVASIIQAVDKLGYVAQLANPNGSNQLKREFDFWSSGGLSRVIIGFLITTPLMTPMLLMAFGIHFEIDPMIQLTLALPVQFWLGWRFYVGAYKALLNGTGNMDLLICIGTTAAFGLSLYLLSTDQTKELYFESSSFVISMVLLGKWLEINAKYKTSSAIRELQKLWPESAHVIDEFDLIQEIKLEQLLPGDHIKVFPSERIPVDGIIEEGVSQIDESLITGESNPIFKTVGQSVIGGSINGDGFLIVKAQAIGIESTLSKMIQLVENVQMQKAPIQKLVDQISAFFVPLVVFISIFTFIGNFYYLDSLAESILRSVSVLVIACPCALGLATPAAIMAGTGVAAKFGILIRESAVLELAHRIKLIAFDKTGTLTKGEPSLLDIIEFDRSQIAFTPSSVSLAYGLQNASEHPLAKAVIQYAKSRKINPVIFTNIKNISGIGIQGETNIDLPGKTIIKLQSLNSLVDQSFYSDLFIKLQPSLIKGKTISILTLDNSTMNSIAIAALIFGDEIKTEAKNVISHLKAMGIETVMISGDNVYSANLVGQEIGIDKIYAQVLPEDKGKWVEKLKIDQNQQRRIVAMVGDGINDAPSLVQADVGIAMGTGTNVAMQAASVTLMRGDLNLVFGAIDISKKTWDKIRQNLFWAFVFNTIGIPLAAFGLLSPMLSGSAMALSSFFVLSNALLLSDWKPKFADSKSLL